MKPEIEQLIDRVQKRVDGAEGHDDIPYLAEKQADGRPGYDAELDLRMIAAMKSLSATAERGRAEIKLLGAALNRATESLRAAVPKHIKELELGSSVIEGLAKEANRLLSKLPLDAKGKRVEIGGKYTEFVLGPTGDRECLIVVAVAETNLTVREIPTERYRKFTKHIGPNPSTVVSVMPASLEPPARRSGSDRAELLRYLRARRGG